MTEQERERLLSPQTPFDAEVAAQLLQDAVDHHAERCAKTDQKECQR
jgi:hypothetical protein